ncbi:bone morphogenetic protein 2-like [Syngnathoides biaculeatus]|uniref:bone morphogenetic protein 2-like n=1 Tax=Syngnathoides biaculeatus TaxID=300417 RepID=UPI002ADE4C08|nr:bone morphogenetic protein 2-like [Syngnathoides biaculeatus]
MFRGVLRAWLVLALQLRCVTWRLAGPGGSRTDTEPDRKLTGALGASFSWRDLQLGAAVAPHKKAPRFMLDLFNAVSASGGARKSQKEILEGNVVRSFEDRGRNGERFHFFNLSSIEREERMIKAEFRWFRRKKKYFLGKSYGPHFYEVDLYEVLDSQVKPWQGNLITSRLVPLYTQGWEIFTVTHTVSKWIRYSQHNNGILVVTTLPPGTWMDSAVMPSKLHGERGNNNAYLVLFSDDGRTGASNRSYFGPAHPAPAASELPNHPTRRRRGAPVARPRGHSRSCQRVPLFVDFEEIGWSGWIISPRGYNAYHCKGSCPFPLGGNLRATNHATVRSIMHALKVSTDEVEAPCCVPDKLQSISLLYFDDEENVVLKQYDDMVAMSCGCH